MGVGLRSQHFARVLGGSEPTSLSPAVVTAEWFEITPETFLVPGGLALRQLDQLSERYRLVPHAVSMSIGSVAPLDRAYLTQLRALVRKLNAPWISDHVCWTGLAGLNTHDLLPLPMTEEVVRHVAERARIVQDWLEVPLLLENVASYLQYTVSDMSECAFVSAVVEGADCGLLLDVNNVYISATNHGFDANEYIDGVPHHRVGEIHLGGHSPRGELLIDTHGEPMIDPVWALYRRACAHIGDVSALVEWDNREPSFEALEAEADLARVVRAEASRAR